MEHLSPSQRFDYAIDLLQDDVRAVRTEAARVLSSVSDSFFSDSQRSRFEEVYEELKTRYTSNLDRAESHLSLGILAENQSDFIEAEKHYRNAIIRDDLFVPARMNLATMLSGQGRSKEAEKLLRDALRIQPSWGQIHYSLGLLLAEDSGRLPEAIRSLERAAGYWPENPRVTFNLGIAYWQNNRLEDALRSFELCIVSQPDNPEFRQRVSELFLCYFLPKMAGGRRPCPIFGI